MTTVDRHRHVFPTRPARNRARSLNGFVRWVARTTAPENSINPYAHNGTRGNAARRHNLAQYLCQMAQRKPKLLLVGEAPGYRGLRETGIPFSSTKLMGSHPFFQSLNLREIPDAPGRAEASATIMQDTLDTLNINPLLWNAYPFHPHKPRHPQSNRKPTAGELRLGANFLYWIIDYFAIDAIVAVGNSAEHTLQALQIPNTKVRHPSRGGAIMFREQLAAFVNGRQVTSNGTQLLVN